MKFKSPKHKTIHQTLVHPSRSNMHIAAGKFHLQVATKIPQYPQYVLRPWKATQKISQTKIFGTSKWSRQF